MGVYKILYNSQNQKIYEGEFEADVREGRGNLYYSIGKIKYTGEWKNDKPDGMGVLFYENGNKFYEGQWQEGKAAGQGVLFSENGVIEYEGHFLESKKNGMGVMYFLDGSKYKGEWKSDQMNGFGSLFYATGGLCYRGTWKQSKKDGNGIILSADNILIYQGSFLEDKKHGSGKSYYNNGILKYSGQWQNDKMCGEGTLYDENGEKIFNGFFKDGKKILSDKANNIEKILKQDKSEVTNSKEGTIQDNEHIQNEYNSLNSTKINELGNDKVEIIKGKENFKQDIELDNFLNDSTGKIKNYQSNHEKKNEDIFDYEDEDEDEDDYYDIDIKENLKTEKSQEEIIDTLIYLTKPYIKDINDDSNLELNKNIIQEQENTKELDNIKIFDCKGKSTLNQKHIDLSNNNNQHADKTNENEDYIELSKSDIEEGNFKYKGNFNNFSKTGNGDIFFKDRKIYTGDIVMGVYEGNGKLYDSKENIIYEGQFKDGKRNGNGKSFDCAKNIIYEGEWKDDVQHGQGKLLNSNCKEIYKGNFYKGKALGLSNSIEVEIDNILYGELENMVGLEEVKDDIARLVSFLKMQILRRRVSYKIMDIPYIFTFEGNVGVGKEEVAKILGKLYYVLGLIPEYNFIQKDLSEALDYSHDGGIEKSMDNVGGGVLYLSNLYENDFDETSILIKNKMAINNIIDLIDYSNGHFIIIFSGDEDLIETMIHNKKELAKLVGKSISFFDYSASEMVEYMKKISKEKEYILEDELINELLNFFEEMLESEKTNNTNAEFLKELFTELVKSQCIRIDNYGVEEVENLKKLKLEDFKNIENKICF